MHTEKCTLLALLCPHSRLYPHPPRILYAGSVLGMILLLSACVPGGQTTLRPGFGEAVRHNQNVQLRVPTWSDADLEYTQSLDGQRAERVQDAWRKGPAEAGSTRLVSGVSGS